MHNIITQHNYIIPFSGPIVFGIQDIYIYINGHQYILGTYSTKQRIIEVLNDMVEKFTNGIEFYTMPEK